MGLRTLHSDQSAPNQVLVVYACPECGAERRLPLMIGGGGNERTGIDERSTSLGAA